MRKRSARQQRKEKQYRKNAIRAEKRSDGVKFLYWAEQASKIARQSAPWFIEQLKKLGAI